jgi:hypothetical protein
VKDTFLFTTDVRTGNGNKNLCLGIRKETNEIGKLEFDLRLKKGGGKERTRLVKNPNAIFSQRNG